MLLMSVINSELPRDSRISNVETLVNKTLCESVSKFCIERECSSCGVDALFSSFEEQISDLCKERKWSCWEKTERCSKDLVFRHSSVSEILSLLKQNVFLCFLNISRWLNGSVSSISFYRLTCQRAMQCALWTSQKIIFVNSKTKFRVHTGH
ncbi:hypothetical protein EGW08_021844, partial [Elysia chlorotica]